MNWHQILADLDHALPGRQLLSIHMNLALSTQLLQVVHYFKSFHDRIM